MLWNPPSELLTSAAVGNLFTRCQRVVRKPIRYVTIHFQDRSGAASLRCKNRAEISDPFVNRSPIRYGFCVGAQAIRYSVDIALMKSSTEIKESVDYHLYSGHLDSRDISNPGEIASFFCKYFCTRKVA